MLLDLLTPIFVVLAFQMAASFVVAFFLKVQYLKSFKTWSYIGFVVLPLAFPLIEIIKIYWPLILAGTLDAAAIAVNIDLIYFLLICLMIMCLVQFIFNTFVLEKIVLRRK